MVFRSVLDEAACRVATLLIKEPGTSLRMAIASSEIDSCRSGTQPGLQMRLLPHALAIGSYRPHHSRRTRKPLPSRTVIVRWNGACREIKL